MRTAGAIHPPTAPAAVLILACGLMLGCGTDAHAQDPGRRSPAMSPTSPHPTPDPTPTGSGGTSPTAQPDDRHGALDGRVLRPAGPDPRSGSGRALVPVAGDHIEVRDQTGHIVATAVTTADGHFHLLLRPGRYQITEGICAVSEHADVKAQTTTSLILTVPNTC